MFGNRTSLTVLRTEHVITATLIFEPVHPLLSSLTTSQGRVWLKQTAGKMSNKHWGVKKTPTTNKCSTLAEFHARYMSSILGLWAWIGCWFTLPYICGGSVCAFACVLVHDCGWNGWNGYAATGCTRLPLAVKEKAWKHSAPQLLLMRLPPLWFTQQVPQISREETKTSNFITTDHTTHLTIHFTLVCKSTGCVWAVGFWVFLSLITGRCNH